MGHTDPQTTDHAVTEIPTRWVGPLRISGNTLHEELKVPLATYESPLWPSVQRGARISQLVDEGIRVTVISERMSRSTIFVAHNAEHAFESARCILERRAELEAEVQKSSRFAKLVDVYTEIVGNLLFVRFAYTTGDASGHNMATAASEKLMNLILSWDLGLTYGSISGNLCTDKKPSAINGTLGRGKNVVAEITLSREIVAKQLRSTPEKIVALSTRKNLVGSTLAASIRSANAHYANMLLGVFLATGQDAANIIEGSQGITYAEVTDEGFYFSCTMPNLIMGTVGNGKDLVHVEENLRRLGCRAEGLEAGASARRLAAITAATVLCGELSLLAAQTNPGELMRTHVLFERRMRQQQQ